MSEKDRIRRYGKHGRFHPGLMSLWAETWAQGCEEIRALQRRGVRWDSSGRITDWPADSQGRVCKMAKGEAVVMLADMRLGLSAALADLSPGTDGQAALLALGLEHE